MSLFKRFLDYTNTDIKLYEKINFADAITKEPSDNLKPRKYNNRSLVNEVCTAMILINNTFLDNILDRGQYARYSENTDVFLNDLQTLLLTRSKIKLGKFVNSKCVEDAEVYKINKAFEDLKFDIKADWNKLVNSRVMARNIIDKLFIDEKLDPNFIKVVYWTGPNKNRDHDEDIVIETTDGKQYFLVLDKSFSVPKTTSFNKLCDEFIGEKNTEKLYGSQYISKWNKLTQIWVTILYENSYNNIRTHIEKFIDPTRIESLTYFDYFDLRHLDAKYQHLGEYIPEFDKNILYLDELLNEVWKNKERNLKDYNKVYIQWKEAKITILNSKILEHIFTESIINNAANTITKTTDNMKLAGGEIKKRLLKLIVERIGSEERTIYYSSRNGNQFHRVPDRQFFRDNVDNFDIYFDYHTKMVVNTVDEEENDFNIKLKLFFKDEILLDGKFIVKCTGGEFSDKLSAKYKFEAVPNFNEVIEKNTNKNV